MGWVEGREGWRGIVGRGREQGKWEPRDFKGSRQRPSLVPRSYLPCPPCAPLAPALYPNWEMFTSLRVC